MEPSNFISIMAMVLTAGLAYLGAQRGVTAQIAKLDAKVEGLSLRVEKHNSVMERTASLEERVRWLEKEMERKNDTRD